MTAPWEDYAAPDPAITPPWQDYKATAVADPSAGGGTLRPFGFDTSIKTPQVLDRLLAGAGRGMVHTGRSIGNLFGLVPNSTLQDEKQTDAPLLNTTSGKIGNIAGETAMTAPLGAAAMTGIGAMGAGGAALAGSGIVNAGIQGGLQGLATADPGERLANTGLGAATGAGLGGLGKLAGKAVYGLTKTPEAETLLKEGVSLTPGQLNPTGIANQFEQTAESIPGVKQIVHGARDSAEQDYQRAVIQKAAVPGTKITPSENIHDMLRQAYESYEPLYDQAKGIPVIPAIKGTNMSIPLSSAFATSSKTPGTTKQAQMAAKSWLDNELTRLPTNPDSADLLKLRSNIRSAARNAKLSTDTVAQDKAAIFSHADSQVTSALQSQLPKQALDALQSADSQYGTYKVVESAVAKSKDNVAGLTPQKLSQAIYDSTSDPSYARGAGGPLRDLAKAGTSVFQTVSPPTGARILTLGAGAGLGYASPAAAGLGGLGLLGLAGTQTGRNLAAGRSALQKYPQALADALKNYTPDSAKAAAAQAGTYGAMPYTPQVATSAAAIAAALRKKKDPEEQSR